MYKLAIFDMDGTTLYTLEDITAGMNYALQANGLRTITLEEIRSFIGNGIHSEVERSVPEGTDPETVEHVFDCFSEWYAIHCNDHTKPYDGIVDLLKDLRQKGILTAIVSNKGDYAVKSLDEIYFKGLICSGVGEKEGIARKPAPDTVNEVLRELRVNREDAVYIGDSEVDLETAKNAGMDCIAVSWGYRSKELLLERGAVQIADSVDELRIALLK